MSELTELEIMVLDKFRNLQKEWNFSEPIINHGSWSTTISYLSRQIAFEIEIDLRDSDVFVLVTRLVDGTLPGGYYVFDGQVVRKHFELILRDHFNYCIPKIALKSKRKSLLSHKETIEQRITKYEDLFSKYTNQILNLGISVFEN